jgi:excisionase family DNA binding protein
MEPDRRALYVRIPLPTAKKLDHFAAEHGISKQDVVADLLEEQLPHTWTRRVVVESADDTLSVGRAQFFPNEPAEVLTPDEAADLLRSDAATVIAMAEDGTIPARKVGDEWRFARTALMRWLGGAEEEE